MGILRRTAERWARGHVRVARLPPAYGRAQVWVSGDARLAYAYRRIGRVDADLLAWVDEWVSPGSVVWDVGANCGVLAIAAAVRAGSGGEVVAIEPDPLLVGLLRRSVAALPSSSATVEIVEGAAGDRSGTGRLFVAARGRASNWMEGATPSTQTGGARDSVAVRRVTLDELARERRAPQLVKIDVEGAEASVLQGAVDLLRASRPTLVVEVAAPNAASVTEILDRAGYAMFDAALPERSRRRLQRPVANTLCVPQGRGPDG